MKNLVKQKMLIVCVVSCLAASCSNSEKYQGIPYTDSEYQTGIQTIPGKVYAAYYDLGGEGVAYHDTTANNHGSGELNPLDGTYLHAFRVDEGVDISYTKGDSVDNSAYNFVEPPMGVLYVGWTEPGEWTKYTVRVEETGNYSVGLLYTSNRGGKISISIDDKDVTGPLELTSTYRNDDPIGWRQWHHWNQIDGLANIHLKKGIHTLTLHTVEEGQMNYMYLDFVPLK